MTEERTGAVFVHHPAPVGVAGSPDFAVWVNGEAVFVYHTPVGRWRR